jgi:predicted DNA-binding transcriptional regulator YafY
LRHLRDAVRFFRIDRIRNVQNLPAEFRLRRVDAFLTAGEDDARTV